MTQQQIAELIQMHRLIYSKIESGQRDISVEALNKIAKYFGMTIDQMVNFDVGIPQEGVIEDKTAIEKMRLIQQLDEEDKQTTFRLMERCLPKRSSGNSFRKIWLHCKKQTRYLDKFSRYSYVVNCTNPC